MNQVKTIPNTHCNDSHPAKSFLKYHDIDYQDVDLFNNNRQAQKLLFQNGQRTIIDKQSIVGLTEKSVLINNTEFDVALLSIN